MSDEIKIFEINDCEWVAARSLEEAKTFYLEMVSGDTSVLDEGCPVELTELQLDRMTYSDDQGDPNASKRSFREELQKRIAAGVQFPEYFATSEF